MKTESYICCRIDDIRLGIPLHYIDRVIRAVAVKPIPNSPQIIHGLIDFYGTVIPVLNLRNRFAIRELAISPDQIFVLITTKIRKLALVADLAEGIITMEDGDIIPASRLDARIEATGIYRTKDGVVIIYDPEQFLSGDDAIELDECIQNLG